MSRGGPKGIIPEAVAEAATDEALSDTDFYTSTQRQAEHRRAGRINRADLANLADEIESLGKSQAAALRSAYRSVAMHRLKLPLQPGRATKGWRATIVRERLNIEQYPKGGPGLKPRRTALFDEAYRAACREAAAETGLAPDRFPVVPRFTIDDAEAEDHWPPTPAP